MNRHRSPSIVALLLLAFAGVAAFAPRRAREEPYLCLDPGGHTASVNRVLFIPPDGRELISAGSDKVVRIWDLARFQTVRTLRGQIGPGFAGQIYAAAIHPDGRTLAVGGYPPVSGRTDAPVFLYDLGTGQITRLLRGHLGNIIALAFSPDGKQLASGGADRTVRLWDVASGKARVLRGHRNDIYGVAFSPDGRQLATASHDRTVRLWNIADGRLLRILAHGDKPENEVQCVAWSPDGATIATGALDHQIRLWDAATGKPRPTTLPAQGNDIACLAFSPDGKWLVSGLGGEPGNGDHTVRVWSMPEGTRQSEFTRHHSTVMSVAFSPDPSRSLVASAGEEPGELFLWNPRTGQEVRQLAGMGAPVRFVAWSRESPRVVWSDTKPEAGQDATGRRLHTFDPRNSLPGPDVPRDASWQGAVSRQGERTLEFVQDEKGIKVAVVLREGGREAARIRQNSRQEHDEFRCFTFTSRGDVVVGSLFTLALYDGSGRRRREFVGHTGQITDVAVSPDGRYLASASLDQTVRIWPLESKASGREIEPLLSILTGVDEEWVAWTPEGYYASSPAGDHMIGWQVNRGVDRAADYYTAYQFRARFYRPDVVRRLLEKGSVREAVRSADADSKKSTDFTLTARSIPEFAPPHTEILTVKPSDPGTRSRVTVEARAVDPNGRPLEVEFRVNGRPTHGEVVARGGGIYSQEMVLPRDGGMVSFIARNDEQAEAENSRVANPAAAPGPRGNLYLLAIGVSNYAIMRPILNFAHKDATDVAATYNKQKGKRFDQVFCRTLTNEAATRQRVVDELQNLVKQPNSQDDWVIIFIAGHGTYNKVQNEYCFAPQDCDPNQLGTTAVGCRTLRGYLAGLGFQVMLVLDTCRSGAAGTVGGSAYAELLHDMTADDRLITIASCQPTESSLERSDWQNGAFTKALVEALEGKADFLPKDGEVTIAEASAYIAARVRDLTGRSQRPSTMKGPIPDDLTLVIVP